MPRIYATKDPTVSRREIENGERARAIAPQGMVLLENNGALPLQGKPGKIALYGNGARRTVKGGTGSGDVNSREVVNVEQGLEAAGFTVVTKDWIDRDMKNMADAKDTWDEKMIAAFKEKGRAAIMMIFDSPFKDPAVVPVEDSDLKTDETDTAIYVLSRNSGEGRDRRDLPGEYELFDEEVEAIRRITAAYKKTIVVLNVGSVIDMKALKAIDGVDAILLMSQAGNFGGYALADVLTGKAYPSGHLTTTWAVNYEDYPSANTFSHRNEDVDDEYYTEGVFVGYRYFDTFNVAPQYPFGYGKSYTDFSLTLADVAADEETICVRVTVTNTGKLPGREVAQVYYSAPEGALEKPYQELAAYAKTRELAPGESETLTLCYPTRSMASYDVKRAAWVLEKGAYIVRYGVHSRATAVAATLTLDADAVTEQLKNQLTVDCQLEQLSRKNIAPYCYPGEAEEKERAKSFQLNAAKIKTVKAQYHDAPEALPKTDKQEKITLKDVREGKATLDELVSQLTPFELATMCVGSERRGFFGDGPQIGASSGFCPGAAGDSTSLLWEDRGVRNLIMPDGPAGLRLTPAFKLDNEGKIYTLSAPFPGFEKLAELMPKPIIPEDAETYYQYTTAIPIATLLAQTWDEVAIEAAGDIVGGEMELFGCDLWLAPGMNIHRNPLCGRNFEYYSEDPLVAGKCAAADTKGVQKHKSAGTTIKHFAFNNQEDNRNHVNAHIDERAIREIYLKGFEIAVREAQPKAIMTSYNLINGEHTANSRQLINGMARDEWGFEGIVMTDWGTTGGMMGGPGPKHKYGDSFASGCVKAGNDLTMPGSDKDVNDILNALDKKAGEVLYPLTLGELQACAKRMIRLIMQMERD